MSLPHMSMTGSALPLLGVGAIFTAVTAGWSQLKNVMERLSGLVVLNLEINNRASRAFTNYCWKCLTPSPSAFRFYTGRSVYIRPLAKVGTVAFTTFGGKNIIFWKGWRPIMVRSGGSGREDSITVHIIRGTFDPDALVKDAMLAFHALESKEEQADEARSRYSRFRVYRRSGTSGKEKTRGKGVYGKEADEEASPSPGGKSLASGGCNEEGVPIGWTMEDLGPDPNLKDPMAHLALQDDVMEAIQEAKRWADSKDWYSERQIPWRRGMLMYGPPGTGKSSLAKALAQFLNMPIYSLDISTMDNREFYDAYQDALTNSPAMVLIEDLDAVFQGRVNMAAEKGCGLSFDCLLNTISGVESSDGVILIITTNNIQHIDPALGCPERGTISSRPGRIDRTVELAYLTAPGRRKIATRIMSGCHDSWIPYLVEKGVKDTGAQFQERCTSIALELFWSADPSAQAPKEQHSSTLSYVMKGEEEMIVVEVP